jgi:hypothetical protein
LARFKELRNKQISMDISKNYQTNDEYFKIRAQLEALLKQFNNETSALGEERDRLKRQIASLRDEIDFLKVTNQATS